LTFNPGWDSTAQKLDTFTDVRELQNQLKAQGVELISEADDSTTDPARFIEKEPDGKPIHEDQQVSSVEIKLKRRMEGRVSLPR
jgi:hypothetical protein